MAGRRRDDPERIPIQWPAGECQTCGDPITYNRFRSTVGRDPSPTFPQGVPKGGVAEAWGHADAMKRDHPAVPEAGRTFESSYIPANAARERAMASVKHTLQRNFDHLHAEQTVNDIFRDRRGMDVGEEWGKHA